MACHRPAVAQVSYQYEAAARDAPTSSEKDESAMNPRLQRVSIAVGEISATRA
jgi:hypothetical protein